jgi:hypothetical protein
MFNHLLLLFTNMYVSRDRHQNMLVKTNNIWLNIKVWYKEVKTQLVYYLLIVLIKRHVSASSEAIINFNKC